MNNIKNIILLGILLVANTIDAQKYFTKTGFTEFKASVDAFEPVEAKNNSTTAILDIENGEIASLLFIKAFNFKVGLMQEHFNENYMESSKYPKAKFKGKLVDFDFKSIEETKTFKLQGELIIKGKSKNIDTKAMLAKNGGKLLLESSFSVKPSDFDIEIPSVVRKKIAETVNINLSYELVEKS